MPRTLPQLAKDNLAKSRSAAIAAVEVYNRPGPRFRTAHFVVLINIAWCALFHAIFYKRRRNPWYQKRATKSAKGIRYVKLDGDYKHWDLAECVKQYYGEKSPPERRNLEFLIGLRNKIEHRHLPALDSALFGECQATLINLEALITQEFGQKHALAEDLMVALQFSTVTTDDRQRALKALSSKSAKSLREYIERFRAALPPETISSMKYSWSVFLVPRVANRAAGADVAVQFLKVDEASKEELERLERLNVLIRDRHIPIQNLDLHKPSEVVRRVRARIPFHFTISTHTEAWRYFKVRPEGGAPHPERTTSQYCIWDRAHRDYVYTDAWVDKLVEEFGSPERYQRIIGGAPYIS